MQAGPCSWTGIPLWCLWFAVILGPCFGRPSSRDSGLPQETTRKAPPKDHVIKEIQESFLDNLGSLKPKFTNLKRLNYSVDEKREHIRRFKTHLELKGSLRKLFEHEETSSSKLFHFRDQEFPVSGHTGRQPSVYFPVDIPHPEDPHQETVVTSAKLRLHKVRASSYDFRGLQRDSLKERDTNVQLYQLLLPQTNSSGPVRKLIHSKRLSPKNLGWERFDITEVVRHWMNFPEENFGLEIVQDNGGVQLLTKNSAKSLNRDNDLSSELFPSVKVHTETKRILGRARRAAETYDCTRGDGEKRCCRYPVWVDFRDIGWDQWVIAPEGYQAHFCDGTCPDRYKPANNFAGIKSILHMLNPRAVPTPCCTATRTDGLNLLHYDEDGNLVVTEYEGMVVNECKCV